MIERGIHFSSVLAGRFAASDHPQHEDLVRRRREGAITLELTEEQSRALVARAFGEENRQTDEDEDEPEFLLRRRVVRPEPRCESSGARCFSWR